MCGMASWWQVYWAKILVCDSPVPLETHKTPHKRSPNPTPGKTLVRFPAHGRLHRTAAHSPAPAGGASGKSGPCKGIVCTSLNPQTPLPHPSVLATPALERESPGPRPRPEQRDPSPGHRLACAERWQSIRSLRTEDQLLGPQKQSRSSQHVRPGRLPSASPASYLRRAQAPGVVGTARYIAPRSFDSLLHFHGCAVQV